MPASVPVAGETLEERLQVVERRVSDLQQQVARLANAADVSRVASPALGDSAIREVQKITEDMFSQPVLIEIEVDPSDPEFELSSLQSDAAANRRKSFRSTAVVSTDLADRRSISTSISSDGIS